MLNRRWVCGTIIGFVCFASFVASANGPEREAAILLRADRLLDVQSGTYTTPGLILVSDGRIEAVGPEIVPTGKEEIVDLPGMTLLPGLIDAHVHLAWSAAQPGDSTLPGADEARLTLEAGFTTVRNLGSTADADIRLAEAVDAGRIPGPRIIPAGTALGLPGGVCDQVFGAGVQVTGASAIRARVAALAEAGARVIKFCAGGGVIPSPADTAAQEFDLESARAIVTSARERGLRVAAHAQGARAIATAVRAGVASIEHGGWIDSTSAALMVQSGTALVPTLYRLDWLIVSADSANRPAQATRLRAVRKQVFGHVSQAARMGVPIVFGTDATVIPHGTNAREFAALTEIGLSPLEAIRAATNRAAALLGLEDSIGVLSKGRAADIVGVAGDPLADIRELEKVRFVMARGRVVRNDPD